MRIVYVLTSLGMGGAERQVLALADRMARRGHAVALLVLRPPLAEQWPTQIETVHLQMRRNPLSVVSGLLRGRRFLRGFRPDLLHSHSFHANFIARLLKLLMPGPVVLSTVHNVYEGGWHRMLAYRLTDWLSSCTTAVSTAAMQRFVSLKAVPAQKCHVVANGIDIVEFAPNPERRAQQREKVALGDAFLWFTAGRIVPAKDFPNLLRAFQRVREVRTDARLWVAGEAAGEEFDVVRGFAAELGIGDAVRWLGLRRDLPALLDAADGFVLGSAWEGMPLVVGEAMAMQKAVVATNVGGVRELMGETGIIVPAKSPQNLADAMLELMERNEEFRQALGRAARARIAGKFSIDAKAEEWETLYRSLTEREA